MTFKPSTTFLGAAAQSALDTTNANVSTNTTSISNISIKTRTESGELTISPAGTHTWAHGLGEVPKTVGLKLKCVGANTYGYPIGAILPYETQFTAWGGTNKGFGTYYDATNVYIQTGSDATPLVGIDFAPANAGITQNFLDNSVWRLIIWAEA